MEKPTQEWDVYGKGHPHGMLKIADLAARLKCSHSFAYGICADGRLAHYRLGNGQGGIRVSEEQLQAYLNGREQGGGGKSKVPPPQSKPPTPRHLSLS